MNRLKILSIVLLIIFPTFSTNEAETDIEIFNYFDNKAEDANIQFSDEIKTPQEEEILTKIENKFENDQLNEMSLEEMNLISSLIENIKLNLLITFRPNFRSFWDPLRPIVNDLLPISTLDLSHYSKIKTMIFDLLTFINTYFTIQDRALENSLLTEILVKDFKIEQIHVTGVAKKIDQLEKPGRELYKSFIKRFESIIKPLKTHNCTFKEMLYFYGLMERFLTIGENNESLSYQNVIVIFKKMGMLKKTWSILMTRVVQRFNMVRSYIIGMGIMIEKGFNFDKFGLTKLFAFFFKRKSQMFFLIREFNEFDKVFARIEAKLRFFIERLETVVENKSHMSFQKTDDFYRPIDSDDLLFFN